MWQDSDFLNQHLLFLVKCSHFQGNNCLICLAHYWNPLWERLKMSQKVNLFLGQVPFTAWVFLCCCSGGAIKTFCVFKAFQLNSDPIKWYHQSSGLCLVVHSFHLSAKLWGLFFFVPSWKIQDPNSAGCPTYFSGIPFTPYRPTGFVQLLRHPWLHCFHALHRNIEILYIIKLLWELKSPC